MSEVTMPSLVEEMSEGVISRWLKRDGDRVERDDELVEIDTDKVTMSYAAPASGYLEVVATEGSTVAVGAVIARLASEPHAAVAAGTAAGPILPAIQDGPPVEPMARVTAPGVLTTPLARQLAERHGLDLATIDGSGPRGRVTRNDVASTLGIPIPEPAPEPPVVAAPVASTAGGAVEELSRLQQTVARRMAASHATVPDFQVETEVRMDRVVSLREELKQLDDMDGPVPSVTDFLVKACALALREHPRVNATYEDDRIVLQPRVNVGVAVAAESALIVPTVGDADELTLTRIAARTRELAERVRLGTLTPADLERATFTVSNLGMYGMTAITPIVDLPQAAILGAGAIRETVALDGAEVVARRLMTLRLSCDHRVLYGADAARFLSRVRERLERPLSLLGLWP